MELSVVIPLHNEEDSITPVITEIHEALRGIDYEILCVDDGSRDDTVGRLRAIRSSSPRVRIIRHLVRSGQSTAIMTGVRRSRSPWIATLDGDGQNDPGDIAKLFRRAREGVDGGLACVCGWRRNRHDSFVKRLSSRIANSVRRGLLRDRNPDTGCGLKVFSREAFLALPYFDHMHRFLPALFLRAGFRTESVEVNHRPREWGRSKYHLHDRLWVGIIDLFGVCWLMRRSRLTEVLED
jgi:dolichol-phosphate mannosyltransferase